MYDVNDFISTHTFGTQGVLNEVGCRGEVSRHLKASYVDSGNSEESHTDVGVGCLVGVDLVELTALGCIQDMGHSDSP